MISYKIPHLSENRNNKHTVHFLYGGIAMNIFPSKSEGVRLMSLQAA